MIGPSDNNSLDKEIKSNESISTGIPAAGYEFIPIESLFNTETIDKQISLLDEPRLNAIVSIGDTINTSNIQTIGNYADPNPSYSSNTFNPVKQQNPRELNDSQDIVDFINNANIDESKLPGIVAPQYASMKQTQFLRYYNHPKFNKLGFSPYSNNEEYYNANSTIWDDLTRMGGQFTSLVGSAFKSSYRSYGDLFDFDSYFTGPDKKTAEEFEQAMMIGSSSRGGAFEFTNNLLLNSAYTFGTIASIAAEELALAAGSAALSSTGVGAPAGIGAFVAGTGRNIARLTTLGASLNASRNFAKGLNNVDRAFDFRRAVKSGLNFGADIISPQTAATIRNWKTTANTAQNLTNLAKASQTAGAFYRDVRRLNYTLAEAKLEGGFAYKDMIETGMALKSAENFGEPVTAEQLREIENRANESAFYTALVNTPILLLTNDLVLGNSLGGFQKSFNRLTKQNLKGLPSKLIKTGNKVPLEYVGDGFKGLMKSIGKAGVKGNVQKIAGNGLRFFAANFGEGIQEVSQEAISAGTKAYYTGLLEDPLAGGTGLFDSAVGSAIDEQFSGQGFETFMSGFLMGGIVQGPQKLFFQGLPAVYNRIKDPVAYQEQKKARKKYINDVVDSYNTAWKANEKDPGAFFDRSKFHLLDQKQILKNLESANFDADKFEFDNEQDRSEFTALYHIYSTGGQDLFREQLEDYLKLSDQDLTDAFSANKKDQKAGDIRQKLNSMIGEIDIMEERYEKAYDLIPARFDPSAFKKGSREYREESFKELADDHTRFLYMFTQHSFDKALERSIRIFERLETEPLFKNMAASDITVLMSPESIDKETALLTTEAELLKESDLKEDKDTLKFKTEKIKKLSKFKDIVTDPKNLTKKGSFARKNANKIKSAFSEYVKFLAASEDNFVNDTVIEDALRDIIDYNSLKGNAKVYSESLESFLIPEKFDRLFKISYDTFKNTFKNARSIFKKQIEKYVGIQEGNTLLNQLDLLNIYPDPNEVELFLQTFDANNLKTFYDDNGEVTAINNPEKLKDINEKIEIYNATRPDKVEEEVEEVETEIENKDLQDISEGVGVQVPKTITPLLSNSLKLAYEEYSSRAASLNQKPLKYNEWLNSKSGKNHKEAFFTIKQLWVANDLLINADNLLTEEQIKADAGLVDWLRSEEGRNDPGVLEVLNSVNLTIDELIGQKELLPEEGSTVRGNTNEVVLRKGPNVSIVEIKTLDSDGNEVLSYKIKDNFGKDISPEILTSLNIAEDALFTTSEQALNAFTKIEAAVPDTTKYVFDNTVLKVGNFVYDRNGNEFIVLTSSKDIEAKGNILEIIPSDKNSDPNRLDFIKELKPGQFENFYTLQKLEIVDLPDNVSKLDIRDITQPYPHVNRETGETNAKARERYEFIISNLKEEEKDQLVIVYRKDPEGGTAKGKLTIGDQPSNPLVENIQAKSIIGLAFGNSNTLSRINGKLIDNKLEPSDSPEGIFAYFKNDNYEFEGVPDPINFTIDQAKNVIDFSKIQEGKNISDEQKLEIIIKSFAKNKLLSTSTESLASDYNGFIPLSALSESFTLDQSINNLILNAAKPQKADELKYNSSDESGNKVIIQIQGEEKKKSKIERTNLQDAAAIQLIDRVNKGLKEAGEIDENNNFTNPNITEKYALAVLLPDGTYKLVPLKPERLSDTELNELFNDVVDRSEKTRNENLNIEITDKTTAKQLESAKQEDNSFNNNFNSQEVPGRLYITSKAKGYRYELQVTSWGNINIQQSIKIDKKYKTVKTVYLKPKEEVGLKTPESKIKALIEKFNKEVVEDQKISLDNFRKSFPRDAGVQEILDKTTTNVQYDVIARPRLFINADSARQQSVIDASISTNSESVKVPVESAQAAVDKIKPQKVERVVEAAPKVAEEFTPNQELVNLEEQLKARKEQVSEGLTGIDKQDAEDQDSQVIQLKKKIREVYKKLGAANKILPANTTEQANTDIEEFKSWAKSNLPDFITIDDINTLGNNMKAGGVRVGAFALGLYNLGGGLTINGTIYTGATNPFKYHEGFHAVYRLLLTDEQQAKYLSIARREVRAKLRKEGKSYRKELERFKNSADTYSDMSDSRLEKEYLEEYMADEFELFKQNPRSTKTDSSIKSLFNRILEWIKALFNSYTKNELLTLFENIDSGKFRTASVKNNNFTTNLIEGVSIEANALIPYDFISETNKDGDRNVGYLYLDSAIAEPMVRSIAARFLTDVSSQNLEKRKRLLESKFKETDEVSKIEITEGTLIGGKKVYSEDKKLKKGSKLFIETVQGVRENLVAPARKYQIAEGFIITVNESGNITEIEDVTPDQVLDFTLREFKWLYSLDNEINNDKSDIQKEQLKNVNKSFDIFGSDIKKDVNSLLSIITKQSADQEFDNEFFESEAGLRTVEQFNKDASMIGGFATLAEGIRAYIATTTLEDVDYFGNKELSEGRPLIVPVEFMDAYNGMLKAVKNLSDPKEILRNMYYFGQDNPNTGAFVNRMLLDTIGNNGIEVIESDDPLPEKIKNSLLIQSILTGFENFRVNYLFMQRDDTGGSLIYSAANRDDVNSQLSRWSQAWVQASKKIKSNKTFKNGAIEAINKFRVYLEGTQLIDDLQLDRISKETSQDLFNYTGIRLSKQYIAFSIAYNRSRTPKQISIHNANQSALPITVGEKNKTGDIQQLLSSIQTNSDIFDPGIEGMSSRLNKMSENNAEFDETVGAPVFKNPNGDLVYAHQLPTFHLKQVEALNNTEKLNDLRNGYLENNYLLNDPAFIKLSNESKLRVTRIAGSLVGKLNETEEEINARLTGISDRSAYGDFTPRELVLSLLNFYTSNYNTKSGKVETVEYDDNLTDQTMTAALAPVLLRVMEASNTGDLLSLAVIKTVELVNGKTKLTEKALDIYLKQIDNEFKRIQRESNSETKSEERLGYNDTDTGRAFKFHNTGLLLDQEIKEGLEEKAKTNFDISLKEALSSLNKTEGQFKKDLEKKLNDEFEKFDQLLVELGAKDLTSNAINKGLSSAPELNLINDKEYNLKQIFFNDWINTTAINEVLLGDQAVSLKDAVDRTKRGKGQNAAFYSSESNFTAPEYGINHPNKEISYVALEEPIGVSSIGSKSIDRADGQLYMTTKAFRYTRFGIGKLTAAQAELLDRVERGEYIPSYSIFEPGGYASNKEMLNSKKMVYYDGETYLKMSAFVLTPEFTSNPDGTAKPSREALHNLRIKLEAIEKETDTIAMASPLSASKMMKQKVNSLTTLDNTEEFENGYSTLETKYFGLQVLNPSNKLETTDPTQIKALVTSEQDDSVEIPGLGLNKKGNVMTVGDVRTLYNEATNRRLVLKYKNNRNLIFTYDKAMKEVAEFKITGKITPNLSIFLDYATESLKASKSSSNLLEFFSKQNGEQKYNLNNPITVNKFEELFLSFFSKGVLSEKIPGETLSLVSDFGMKVYRRVYEVDADGNPVRSEVIREKQWEKLKDKPEIFTLSNLTNDKIPAEGIVVLDRLRTGLMEYTNPKDPKTATGQRYSEGLVPAHHASVRNLIENTAADIPEAISKMFAVRIPSQDNHSTINVKLIDFLPTVYGSVAMFPQEMVEISGADFDIDKVFTQIKEFYVEDNKFYEYGATEGRQYKDYIKYVNEKVNENTPYAKGYRLYETQGLNIEDSYTDAEMLTLNDLGFTDKSIKALTALGLPVSKKQYEDYKSNYGEPYEAPYNNKILDYKYALMGNRGVTEAKEGTPISYTPAGLEILTDKETQTGILELLEELLPGLKEKNREDNVDVDNMLGKTKAWMANKGSAIGAIVLPNTYLSLLTEYKLELKGPAPFLNGKPYNDFGVLNEKFADGTDGNRKQDIISSLITAMTDNAKERLAAKLGLNRHSLGIVANATALGIPLKTSLLLVNNPLITSIYDQAFNKKEKTDPGVKSILKAEIDKLDSVKTSASISDDILIKYYNDVDGRADDIKLGILLEFQKLLDIKDFTSKMSSVTTLANGLDKNITDVNKRVNNISDLFAKGALIDLNKVFRGSTWQSGYLKIFEQVYNDILPATFLSGTENFRSILDDLYESINTNTLDFTEEVESKISRDLLSYLTIKAYQKNKLDTNSQSVATLNNSYIYPSVEGGQYKTITDTINTLREQEDLKDNFFVQNFTISNPADDQSNTTGLELLEANTFRNLNQAQMIDLQTSFARLYGSVKYKQDAIDIVNYMMVKDGLQIGYASLIQAISPFMMEQYLNHVDTASNALRSSNNELIESAFGLNFEDLKSEFIEGYLLSNRSNTLLNNYNFTTTLTGDLIKPENVNIVDNTLTAKSEDVNPLFVRVTDTFEGRDFTKVTYKTYRLTGADKDTATYTEVETTGSNQQNPIGFMFGDRPTYNQVREYVKSREKKEDTVEEEQQSDRKDQVKERAARRPGANIVVTGDNIEIDGVNLDDILEEPKPAQQTSKVKEGVSNVFEENKELSKIGTEQQYSDYLDTLFPDSKVKDIVYHGTPDGRFDNFDINQVGKNTKQSTKGIYFTDSKKTADFYAEGSIDFSQFESLEEYNAVKTAKVFSAILNAKNLKLVNNPQAQDRQGDAVLRTKEKLSDKGFVGELDYAYQYIVFEPEQIHILGSKKDLKGFKEFVGKPAQQTSEVETITYTPKGKQRQTYTIEGNKIFNSKGAEVFKEDSTDRNKIFANLAVKQGRAVVVNYKGTDYVVNNKQDIMSTVSGNIMNWGPENGNRKDILAKVNKPTQQTSADDTVDPALLDELDNINEDAQQLTPDLFNVLKNANEEINNNYTIIENFWDSNIQFNKENKNSLREKNNILSLEDLIKEYKKGIYNNQEEFVEQIKKCNL